MLTVNIIYHAMSRMLEIEDISTGMDTVVIGTIGDDRSTRIHVTFDGDVSQFSEVYAEFDVKVPDPDRHTYIKPSIKLDDDSNALLPAYVLSNVVKGVLPMQLILINPETDLKAVSINSLMFRVADAIDADLSPYTEIIPEPVTTMAGVFVAPIGDGINTTFTIHHNLDTYSVGVLMYRNSDNASISIDWILPDENTVQITFPTPPAYEEYTVTVFRAGNGIFDAIELYTVNSVDELVTQTAAHKSAIGLVKTTKVEDIYILTTDDPTSLDNWQILYTVNPTFDTLTVKGTTTTDALQIPSLQNGILVTDSTGTVSADSSIDLTELSYLDGLTGNIQAQINGEIERASTAESGLDTRLTAVESKIPEEATASNKLADKAYVDSHDTALRTLIDDEVSRSTSKDIELESDIDSLETRVGDLESDTVNAAGTYLTKSERSILHNTTTRSDSESTQTAVNGGTISVVDSVSTDADGRGHVTGINIKTITLPTVGAGTGLSMDGAGTAAPTIKHVDHAPANDTDVGGATAVPIIRNDAQGHLTKVDSAPISIPTSQVTSLGGYTPRQVDYQALADTDTLNQALGKLEHALSDGSVTKIGKTTVGSAVNPVYLDNGTPSASDATRGSSTKPIYLNSGIITESDGSVGGARIPVYLNAGSITAGTELQDAAYKGISTSISNGSTDASVPTAKAVEDFVNSSISTNTATFRGTYNALQLGITQAEIDTWTSDDETAQATVAGLIPNVLLVGVTPTNNDYVFIAVDQTPIGDSGEDWYWRYKYSKPDSATGAWVYEFTLNNSSFTQAQWDAINSGITPPVNGKYTINISGKADTASLADRAERLNTSVAIGSADTPVYFNANGQPAAISSISLDLISEATQASKGLLSANDKTKLDGIEAGAEVNVQADWDESVTTNDDYIKNKPLAVNTWAQTPSQKNYPSEKLVKDSLAQKADLDLSNVSGLDTTKAGQALLVSSTGGVTFGEAGKVDEIQINGTTIAPVSGSKVANITTGAGLQSSSNAISHVTSSVTAGTYQSVTVDQLGHVTDGSNIFEFRTVYIEEVD